MPPGAAQALTRNDEKPLQEMRQEADMVTKRLIQAAQLVRSGLLFWGQEVGTNFASSAPTLDAAKDFFDSLSVFNSLGKLKNFRNSQQEISVHAPALTAMREPLSGSVLLTLIYFVAGDDSRTGRGFLPCA